MPGLDEHNYTLRLQSCLGYITPKDRLKSRPLEIQSVAEQRRQWRAQGEIGL